MIIVKKLSYRMFYEIATGAPLYLYIIVQGGVGREDYNSQSLDIYRTNKAFVWVNRFSSDILYPITCQYRKHHL